jgi:hypothetical protein
MFDSFFPYSQKVLGFNKQFSLNFASDQENSANPLGKTAYYDPSNSAITIYVDGRHIKDIMRSISHELVHHAQNCRGEFDKGISTDAGYAQEDGHLRGMEREAYEKGNLCFRDWEDQYKQLRENKMAKLAKEEIKKLLKESGVDAIHALTKFEQAVKNEKWDVAKTQIAVINKNKNYLSRGQLAKYDRDMKLYKSNAPKKPAAESSMTFTVAGRSQYNAKANELCNMDKAIVHVADLPGGRTKYKCVIHPSKLSKMKDTVNNVNKSGVYTSRITMKQWRELPSKKKKQFIGLAAKASTAPSGTGNFCADPANVSKPVPGLDGFICGKKGAAVNAKKPAGSKSAAAPPRGPRWRTCKKVIKRGCEGDNVTVIQRKLQDLGFYKKPLDKKFGGGTRAAVIAFQKDNSLEPDGAVGNNTIKVLDKVWRAARTARKSVATSAAQPLSTNTARPAQMGESVDFSQKHLEPIRERFITIYKRLLRNK